MKHDTFIKSDAPMKFINLLCKIKSNYPIDKIIGMKKSEFVMLLKVDSKIEECGTATVSEISKEMKMTSAGASKTISLLEDAGYIKKKVNKEDKRQAYIELTEKGKEKLVYIKSEINDFTTSVFDKFGKENADNLFELLEKMNAITSTEMELRLKKAKKEDSEKKTD